MTDKIDELLKLINGEKVKPIIEEEERNPDYAYCVDCDNIITTEKKDDNAAWIYGEIWVCGKCMNLKMN